jgi:hypothetical protein
MEKFGTIALQPHSNINIQKKCNSSRCLEYGSSNTNALAVGGSPSPSARLLTELWNGSSWTEVGDTSTSSSARGGAGDTSSALVFGGGVLLQQTQNYGMVQLGQNNKFKHS